MEPVNEDRPRDHLILSPILRWSQLSGCYVLLRWFTDQPTVVSIDRWSFFTGDPSSQVVFKTGFTVHSITIHTSVRTERTCNDLLWSRTINTTQHMTSM